MEELQVIETTSGRQFKPWATKDDVQDPSSVTALASEIASGKQAIAAAINAKSGSASATESFGELADDIVNINDGISPSISYVGEKPDMWKLFGNSSERGKITAINDATTTVFNVEVSGAGFSSLCSISMTALRSLANFTSFPSLKEIYVPSLTTANSYAICNCTYLERLTIGKMTNSPYGMISSSKSYGSEDGNYLYRITIGDDFDISFSGFSFWNPKYVADDALINDNFIAGIVNKLHDYSGGSSHTFRLNANLLNRLSPETISLATAKNWILSA